MGRVTVRDLWWRRRRVAIAVVGAALVFAITLMIAGLAQGFRAEIDRTLAGIGADSWVVTAGSSGPFSALSTLPESRVAEVAALPGVQAAAALVILHETVHLEAGDGRIVDVIVMGVDPGKLGSPNPARGSALGGNGEMVADDSLGFRPGDHAKIAGRRLTVVGTTRGLTLNAGAPVIFVPLVDAQAIGFDGQHVVTAVVTTGIPGSVPDTLSILDNDAVKADLLRPLARAVRSLDLTQWLLWAVAATIIASVVYLSVNERIRDFAVLKATGASSISVIASVAVQAEVMSVTAAVLAIGVAYALVPLFPLAVGAPVAAVIALPAVAVVVGGLACLAGARRVLSVDPLIALTGPA